MTPVEVIKHYLPPTSLVPNSPRPLLHYPGFLSKQCAQSPNAAAVECYGIFEANGWHTQWVIRYGTTQSSHYHSRAHECMVVLSGSATIRFGVADTDDDLEQSTYGAAREDGGVEIRAAPGDVFVIPAGVAHKTHDAAPRAPFAILTPGDGHAIDARDPRRFLADVELTGFTMMGAYPAGGGDWDFAKGGEDVGHFDRVWAVGKPAKDPILGEAEEGLGGLWQ
ncbi:hypothetical protein F4809DRAFT_630783 [Biscogniauxia mediterranea]|nr:hypothetical protein F4809DRAFT_630783 [Biscogniauxia mediterranea]